MAKSKWKISGYIFLGFIGFLILLFGLNLLGLKWLEFFKPKYQNVERKVFEQTKSYVHGVIQDLGKYYAEYQKADEVGKEVIKDVVKTRFAEFESRHITNVKLKDWFISLRGY